MKWKIYGCVHTCRVGVSSCSCSVEDVWTDTAPRGVCSHSIALTLLNLQLTNCKCHHDSEVPAKQVNVPGHACVASLNVTEEPCANVSIAAKEWRNHDKSVEI